MIEPMWTVFLLVFISLVLGAGAWLLFVWSVRTSQYEDVEAPKHRMLDDGGETPARDAGKDPTTGREGRSPKRP